MFTLHKKEMKTAVAGACVLASGGGGSYRVALEIIELGIRESDQVGVSALEELRERGEEWLAASANMGAPDALFKTANPHAPANAFRALESELHMMVGVDPRFAAFPRRGCSWVLPIEVGAINTASPLTVAAQIGRDRSEAFGVVDADCAGRSIPTLSLTVFAANGIPVSPSVAASEGLMRFGGDAADMTFDSGVIRVNNEVAAEDAIIGLVMSEPFGGIAGLGFYPMTARELLLRSHPVGGTLSLALEIGQVLESTAGVERANQVAACIRRAGRASEMIWHGRVKRVVQSEGGVDVGRIVLEDASGSGADLTIYNENENVFAIRSDQDAPCVIGPDSICYVTAGNDPLAIDNTDLNRMYEAAPDTRLELFVLAVQAAPEMRNRVIIDNFSVVNRTLGYGGAYVPWPRRGVDD